MLDLELLKCHWSIMYAVFTRKGASRSCNRCLTFSFFSSVPSDFFFLFPLSLARSPIRFSATDLFLKHSAKLKTDIRFCTSSQTYTRHTAATEKNIYRRAHTVKQTHLSLVLWHYHRSSFSSSRWLNYFHSIIFVVAAIILAVLVIVVGVVVVCAFNRVRFPYFFFFFNAFISRRFSSDSSFCSFVFLHWTVHKWVS